MCLIGWFLENKRDLPWRRHITPYRVWVSEIMLQQTRANAVVPYFSSFIKKFSSVRVLAKSSEEEVVKAWEGLGYYSRVRNLRKGAGFVMERFGGDVPSHEGDLRALPGVGEYTAGAIQAFAFHKRVAAVDGNVLRVVARLYGLQDVWGSTALHGQVKHLVLRLLPKEGAWVFMEALIELGALVCGKIPLCFKCPLQRECVANQKGLQGQIPKKLPPAPKVRLIRDVFILWSQGKVLVVQEGRKRIMEGLCHFPYQEVDQKGLHNLAQAGLGGGSVEGRRLEEGILGEKLFSLRDYKHSFTKYQVTLKPSFWKVHESFQLFSAQWIPVEALAQHTFCSGHRQIAQWLLKGGYKKNIHTE